MVENYQGHPIAVCGNAVDVICKDVPRKGETKIVTRGGAVLVTKEPFDDVMRKYDYSLRRINVRSDNNGE